MSATSHESRVTDSCSLRNNTAHPRGAGRSRRREHRGKGTASAVPIEGENSGALAPEAGCHEEARLRHRLCLGYEALGRLLPRRPRHAAQVRDPALAGSCPLGFVVEDLDAFHKHMQANKVACLHPPKKEEFGRLALYADPDGLPFSVAEPPKGKKWGQRCALSPPAKPKGRPPPVT